MIFTNTRQNKITDDGLHAFGSQYDDDNGSLENLKLYASGYNFYSELKSKDYYRNTDITGKGLCGLAVLLKKQADKLKKLCLSFNG